MGGMDEGEIRREWRDAEEREEYRKGKMQEWMEEREGWKR